MCYLPRVNRFIPLLLASLVLLAARPALAQDRALVIRELSVFDLALGADSAARSFDYEEANELGLYALLDIRGLDGRRNEKVDMFMVVYRAEDEERKHPLLKQKRTESLGNGEFVVEFREFMDADSWFDDCDFTAVLEASLKGAKTVSLEQDFTIEGPRMPSVGFDDFQVYSWEEGPGYDRLEAGDEFVIDLVVTVDGNETGLEPRLRLLAVMEDDLWFMDPEDEYLPSGPNWNEAWLRGGGSEWRVYARGRLPIYYEHPFDYYHDWRIYAFVSFGENPQRESDYIMLTLTDPDAGELRETDNVVERLPQLVSGAHWTIRQTKGPMED